jgi:hypothetical protein
MEEQHGAPGRGVELERMRADDDAVGPDRAAGEGVALEGAGI